MPSSIIGIRPRIPYCVSPVIMIIVDTAIGPNIAENLENTEKNPKNSLESALSGISLAK